MLSLVFQVAAVPPALTPVFFLSTLKFRVLAYACTPRCQIQGPLPGLERPC